MRLTLSEIRRRVEQEGDAYRLLEELRWPTGPVCPHCGNIGAYFLKPKNGTSRKTTKGTYSQRRVWKCSSCRKQFSVLTGTIFHGTKVSIETWLMVMVQMCSAKNGISAREVERMHGVTPETAWYMLHRLREAMKREPLASILSGTVVSDETWVGGKPKNRPAHKRGYNTEAKTPVVALVHRETGEVRARVVPNVTGASLRTVLDENVQAATTHLQTDESTAYRGLGPAFAAHSRVNHGKGEYVSKATGATTNPAESFFAQFKRSLDGTHHGVSKQHLGRYAAEFEFRWNTSRMNDAERLQKMVDQAAGRRLTYQPLTPDQ